MSAACPTPGCTVPASDHFYVGPFDAEVAEGTVAA